MTRAPPVASPIPQAPWLAALALPDISGGISVRQHRYAADRVLLGVLAILVQPLASPVFQGTTQQCLVNQCALGVHRASSRLQWLHHRKRDQLRLWLLLLALNAMVDNLLNMPVAMLVSSALRAGFRTLVRKHVPFAPLDILGGVARPPDDAMAAVQRARTANQALANACRVRLGTSAAKPHQVRLVVGRVLLAGLRVVVLLHAWLVQQAGTSHTLHLHHVTFVHWASTPPSTPILERCSALPALLVNTGIQRVPVCVCLAHQAFMAARLNHASTHAEVNAQLENILVRVLHVAHRVNAADTPNAMVVAVIVRHVPQGNLHHMCTVALCLASPVLLVVFRLLPLPRAPHARQGATRLHLV